jgi:hypothetical protein
MQEVGIFFLTLLLLLADALGHQLPNLLFHQISCTEVEKKEEKKKEKRERKKNEKCFSTLEQHLCLTLCNSHAYLWLYLFADQTFSPCCCFVFFCFVFWFSISIPSLGYKLAT